MSRPPLTARMQEPWFVPVLSATTPDAFSVKLWRDPACSSSGGMAMCDHADFCPVVTSASSRTWANAVIGNVETIAWESTQLFDPTS